MDNSTWRLGLVMVLTLVAGWIVAGCKEEAGREKADTELYNTEGAARLPKVDYDVVLAEQDARMKADTVSAAPPPTTAPATPEPTTPPTTPPVPTPPVTPAASPESPATPAAPPTPAAPATP